MATLISDKVNITAPTIQLTGSININNGTFTVDTSGNMTAKSGTFSGTLVSGDRWNSSSTNITGIQIGNGILRSYGTSDVIAGAEVTTIRDGGITSDSRDGVWKSDIRPNIYGLYKNRNAVFQVSGSNNSNTELSVRTDTVFIGDTSITNRFELRCSGNINASTPQFFIDGGDCKATKFFCYHDDVGAYRDLGSFTGQSVYNGTSKCYLGGNLIQYGLASFTNLSANTPSTQTISFSASFEYPPVVIACPNTTVPQKISVGTSSVTTSSFSLTCTRTNSTETKVFWVAIGSRA